LLSSLILIASPEPKSLHTTAAAFGQTIQRASRGPVLFSGSIQNEAATADELPAELVIARFVREQSLLARSGPYVSGRWVANHERRGIRWGRVMDSEKRRLHPTQDGQCDEVIGVCGRCPDARIKKHSEARNIVQRPDSQPPVVR
jgi:hypothetical protein